MKPKTLWLIGLLGGWVGFVSFAIAQTQAHYAQSASLQSAQQPSVQPSSLPPALAGLDLTQWPQHCRQLRRELNHTTHQTRRGQPLTSSSPNQVTYRNRPVQPFAAPAWKLRWQGSTFAIPAVRYHQLMVLRQDAGALTVVLEADVETHTDANTGAKADTNKTHPIRVVLTQHPVPASIPNVRGAIASLEGVELVPLRGRRNLQTEQLLAKQLFDNSATTEKLIELAYQHQPDHLSCQLDQWQTDLPMAMALELKQAQLGDVVAVYPQVGMMQGRVVHRRTAQPNSALFQTEWQAQLTDQDTQSELWVLLPENHASASVGLGFGQDNWWEAEGRPPWLDALEVAIASPISTENTIPESTTQAITAWQQLANVLETSNLSRESVRSVRHVAAELFHDVQRNPLPTHQPDSLSNFSTNPAAAR